MSFVQMKNVTVIDFLLHFAACVSGIGMERMSIKQWPARSGSVLAAVEAAVLAAYHAATVDHVVSGLDFLQLTK